MLRIEKCRRLGSVFSKYARFNSYDTSKLPSIMDEIHALGKVSDVRKILSIIDPFPLNAVIEAAVDDLLKRNQNSTRKRNLKDNYAGTAFSYIFHACTRLRSPKTQRLIECVGDHPVLANYIGPALLFHACVVLHDYQKRSGIAMSSARLSRLKVAKDDDLQIFCEKYPIGGLFLSHYTDWLVAMDSAQRVHNTVDLLAYKHDLLDTDDYCEALIKYLHYLGNTASEKESSLYYTAVNDITMAGYTAAKLFKKEKLAISRITNECLKPDSISKESFSLAVTSLIKSNTFVNLDDPESKKYIDALLTTCNTNSFNSINLRAIFLQVEIFCVFFFCGNIGDAIKLSFHDFLLFFLFLLLSFFLSLFLSIFPFIFLLFFSYIF